MYFQSAAMLKKTIEVAESTRLYGIKLSFFFAMQVQFVIWFYENKLKNIFFQR